MSTTTQLTESAIYITKINQLVNDGREDLIGGIVADYERGKSAEPVQRTNEA